MIAAVLTAFLILLTGLQCSAVVYVHLDAPGPEHNGDSWAAAYVSVQQGIDDAAASGDQVWVARGHYLENITMRSGVAIYGGFTGVETLLNQRDWAANRTIIDASGSGRVVVGADNSRLDGFIVTGGRASYGAGILCWSTSPVIANCVIEDNAAVSFGGGLYISYYSSAQIINCRIANNSARDGGGAAVYIHSAPLFDRCIVSGNKGNWGSGLLFSDNTNPTVTNCEITDNRGDTACYGGGIHLLHNTGTIRGNLIARNSTPLQGGGIYGYDTTALIEGNLILENSAGLRGGGISMRYSQSEIRNNLLVGNTAPSGAGVECAETSALTLAYNTIVSNRANLLGGGIQLLQSASAVVSNCIISSNRAAEGSGIYAGTGCSCEVSYSDIFDNDLCGVPDPGFGCISADPMFCAPEACEYHLSASSPCIDAGSPTPAVTLDMDFNPRAVDGNGDGLALPDMGCSEHAAGPLRAWFVAQAKALPDGTPVRLFNKPISARFDGFFYVQDVRPASGIRVIGNPSSSRRTDVFGALSTAHGERVIAAGL